jgi:hypothetical protein
MFLSSMTWCGRNSDSSITVPIGTAYMGYNSGQAVRNFCRSSYSFEVGTTSELIRFIMVTGRGEVVSVRYQAPFLPIPPPNGNAVWMPRR